MVKREENKERKTLLVGVLGLFSAEKNNLRCSFDALSILSLFFFLNSKTPAFTSDRHLSSLPVRTTVQRNDLQRGIDIQRDFVTNMKGKSKLWLHTSKRTYSLWSVNSLVRCAVKTRAQRSGCFSFWVDILIRQTVITVFVHSIPNKVVFIKTKFC